MLLSVTAAGARVKLHGLVSNNAVMQQKTTVNIAGTAAPGATVTVTASWDGKTSTTVADSDGWWSTLVKTPAAGGPYTLTASDGEPVTVSNILIGEVWICSGQSNMELRLSTLTRDMPVIGSAEAIASADGYPMIRCFDVQRALTMEPQKDVAGHWEISGTKTTPKMSAVAWFFAREIVDRTGVPVGIVTDAWSGSRIEAWMPLELLEGYEDVQLTGFDPKSDKPHLLPMMIYNGMHRPLSSCAARGFLWYQGESNSDHNIRYADKMRDMVARWRKDWKNENMPFYYVQLCPLTGNRKDGGMRVRIEQQRAMGIIPHSGMISTVDLGSNLLHPLDKQNVGKRLAYWALAKDYGVKTPFLGPEPVSAHLAVTGEGGAKEAVIEMKMSGTGSGLRTDAEEQIAGFEIAGADSVFMAVAARITGKDMVTITVPKGTEPRYVQFSYRYPVIGKIYSSDMLPPYPFILSVK